MIDPFHVKDNVEMAIWWNICDLLDYNDCQSEVITDDSSVIECLSRDSNNALLLEHPQGSKTIVTFMVYK